MSFSKSFPRTVGKSSYPVWEEVSLSDDEEKRIEKTATVENTHIMEKCVRNAERLFLKNGLKMFQSDVVRVAVALFEKRASHEVYHKERLCKDKFDKKFEKK